MSVTLKPKKNNMYKVTKVGDKMKKHGGIKKGEKFHDSQIDGMHDSGIKVKYQKEATAAEVLKKRYASYNPAENPQATRRLRDDEHDQPKGARVWKMHPGAKLTDRGYSKKGKMAALKKQHERRPEQYGICLLYTSPSPRD